MAIRSGRSSAAIPQASVPNVVEGDIHVNLRSFARAIRAENLSQRTQQTYMEACRQFARYLAEQGMPKDLAAIKREHVEAFINHLLERWKPATANNRYRGLQSFFKWALAEGEIKQS